MAALIKYRFEGNTSKGAENGGFSSKFLTISVDF